MRYSSITSVVAHERIGYTDLQIGDGIGDNTGKRELHWSQLVLLDSSHLFSKTLASL